MNEWILGRVCGIPTADRLAQLVEHWTVRDVVGSNRPAGRTNTQGLEITEEKVLPL